MLYVTYDVKNKFKVTVISAQLPCVPNDNQEFFKIYFQQWDILVERLQENENIRDKIIQDLTIFIQSLSVTSHETVVCID